MRLKMLLRSLRTSALCSAPTDATARTFRIRNDIKENEMIIRRIILVPFTRFLRSKTIKNPIPYRPCYRLIISDNKIKVE